MTVLLDIVGGTRPNFVKLAALARAFRSAQPAGVETRWVHTGQHKTPEMSELFWTELGLPEPNVQLDVGSGSHAEQTAAVLTRYERVLLSGATPPRAVIVVGDVNSTLACALAASKLKIPVVHIEAGLRCRDRTEPEEINRCMTDVISELLLASEPSAMENLRSEGIGESRIRYTGSLIIDTLRYELASARALRRHAALGLEPRSYALVTLHRPQNVDHPERLTAIIDALERVGRELSLVMPIHPRTAARLDRFGLHARLARAARLLPPQPYRATLSLMDSARVVLTDSGSIQEETTELDVPCLTLRSATERPATVEHGTNRLLPEVSELPRVLLEVARAGVTRRGGHAIPGWDGGAASRALQAICERFV